MERRGHPFSGRLAYPKDDSQAAALVAEICSAEGVPELLQAMRTSSMDETIEFVDPAELVVVVATRDDLEEEPARCFAHGMRSIKEAARKVAAASPSWLKEVAPCTIARSL